MTTDKGILIYNIYYMLSYAFQELRRGMYENIDKESFDNIEDLFAEILYVGVSYQLKQGLYREYIEHHEVLPLLKGKLDVDGSIRLKVAKKQQLSCLYDELSVNNTFNQILKITLSRLAKADNVSNSRRASLRKLLPFFDVVSEIDVNSIHWNMLRFQRNNRFYRMLMNICRFVLEGMLLTTQEGKYHLQTFSEDHMARLYEKFILEYYRRHHPELNAEAIWLDWNLDEDKTIDKSFLPQMHTDITLQKNGKTLIIDAKYYSSMLTEHFGKYQLHSGNLYQIHTYVTSTDVERTGNVIGMLLYAKGEGDMDITTDITQKPNIRLLARTLDLNKPFEGIKEQLENIVTILN